MPKASIPPPQLVRPSQLARFWGLNHETVLAWIQRGRLPAIRSPGNHFRLRVAEVRAFCEREGMPPPPFIVPPPKRVVVGGAPEALRRALVRALRPAVGLDLQDDTYGALVSAARAPATILVLGPGGARFDAAAAIRAIRALRGTDSGSPGSSLTIVAFGASTRSQKAALRGAGADHVLGRTPAVELQLPRLLRELVGLEPE